MPRKPVKLFFLFRHRKQQKQGTAKIFVSRSQLLLLLYCTTIIVGEPTTTTVLSYHRYYYIQ